MGEHSRQDTQTDNPFRIISKEEVDEMLQEGRTLIDTFLRQEGELASIVQSMRLKINVCKSFTEFLLYIIKLFQNAIDNKTITLTNSARQSVKSKLSDIILDLNHVLDKLRYSQDDTQSLDSTVAIVVRSAVKVQDIITNLQKKQWLRWFRSAKNISALVPIFKKITQVVEGIQCVECREFSELLGDVEELRASLDDIKKRVLVLETVGLTTAIIFAVGGIICLIVGGILLVTPAAPAGVPLLVAGGTGVGAAFTAGCGTELSALLARRRLDRAKAKGDRKGDKFVDEDSTELLQPC